MPVNLEPSKIIRVPPYGKISEKLFKVDLFTPKQASGCTECNTRSLSPLECTVSEKIKKKCKNRRLFVKAQFGQFFGDFFRNRTLQRAEVLGVAFSALRRFF